ncbi:MAG: YbjQ family protein [Planctomycetes bacterium]|nr:YbjQ family protein [Planctomycetota bacterium]MCB9871900.1 YbjQ family protein [Planctomycetota bacterium]MCB9888850.1 YbjQ family protein [Planctomycetota bacterium]
MLVVTSDDLSGYRIVEVLGLVRGSSIRTRHLLADITEWLRNLVGAELHHYTKMMAEAREQALDRMVDQARGLGADAVVGARFATSAIAAGASEMLAYGTAVRVEKI